MEEKPWWVYACEIVISVRSIALVGMMVAYFTSTDGPPVSFGTFWVVFAFVLGVGSLLASLVVIKRLRGEHGGLLALLSDMVDLWRW